MKNKIKQFIKGKGKLLLLVLFAPITAVFLAGLYYKMVHSVLVLLFPCRVSGSFEWCTAADMLSFITTFATIVLVGIFISVVMQD